MTEDKIKALSEIEKTLRACGLLEHGFSGEVMLLSWSKSTHRDGPKVKFLFDDDDQIEPFASATVKKGKTAGQLYHVFAIPVDDLWDNEPPVKPHGDLATKIYRQGFLFNPRVLRAIGTDEDFRRWVSQQICVACGDMSWSEEQGRFYTVAAHVLRADAPPAREGPHPNKPGYACVPLCDRCHRRQHQNGELACLTAAGHEVADVQEAKDWFNRRRDRTVEQWAKTALAQHLGAPSLGYVDPRRLYNWAQAHHLESFLPKEYREVGQGSQV